MASPSPDLLRLAEYVRGRCVRTDEGCLIWSGCMLSSRRQTPIFNLTWTKETSPRRVLWKATGRRLSGNQVLIEPVCDSRCCEPAHQRRMARSGYLDEMREKCAGVKLALACARRARALSSLDVEKVASIRLRHAAGEKQGALALEHGVNRTTVGRIVRYETWRDANVFSGMLR